MYLLSQLWLYLLLACLAGLALGLLLSRICQQRRHAAQLEAMQALHREERVRSEAALTALRGEHALALETAAADRAALQTQLEALDSEHRLTGERALALSASVDEHHAARQGLGAEIEALRGDYQSLQASYESRIALLNTETSRTVQLADELTALKARHAALEDAHHKALDEQAAVAKEAYAALLDTQSERDAARAAAADAAQQHAGTIAALEGELASLRDTASSAGAEAVTQAARAAELDAALSRERLAAATAAGLAAAAALAHQKSHEDTLAALERQSAELLAQRDHRITELNTTLADQDAASQAAEQQAQALREAQAAGQSAAQLREQALQQELAQSKSVAQGLEAELQALRLTLAENDEQLATLSARLKAERDQQQAAQARMAELAALVPLPAPEVPRAVRPAVSEAASLTGAELERLVLAAGAGQQPAPVEVDHQRPDDLKVIDGIGPVNERWLHAQGVRYFWQIASWSPAELAWVAHHLPNFGSRVYRENWIAQAAKLAAAQSTR